MTPAWPDMLKLGFACVVAVLAVRALCLMDDAAHRARRRRLIRGGE